MTRNTAEGQPRFWQHRAQKISVKNYMSDKIDGAIGFIDRLDESCPNSLWRTTGVEPESGDASAWE
jgi:hypothetical protein